MDVETYVHDNILITGEEIVWRGRPDVTRVTRRDLPRALFGIAFAGFAVFWTVSAAAQSGLLFGMMGLPFIAIGSWVASSPIRERSRAGRTYYAVTTERALIIEMGKNVRTISIAPDDITDLQRVERPDGRGDLRLRRTRRRVRRGHTRYTVGFEDGFWGADDIKGAANAVDQLVGEINEPAVIDQP